MDADQDRAAKIARLEAKLKPERIRATLAFAGLYQLTHELIKTAVLDNVKNFYLAGFDESGMLYDEVSYKADVLDLDKSRFRASLLWLVGNEAITQAQADRLDKIYAHRHELTHGLGDFILDPDREPNMDLFIDAVEILRNITRYWTQYEIDIGSFEERGDVSVDDVAAGTLIFLEMCIDAYSKGLPEAKEDQATEA